VEAAAIPGHPGQVTPDIDSLLSSDPDDGNWRNRAIIGGPWENDSSLALGFFELADAAVERWKAGHRNDTIVIPIIYNYRHGIELALKDEIREAATCLRRVTASPAPTLRPTLSDSFAWSRSAFSRSPGEACGRNRLSTMNEGWHETSSTETYMRSVSASTCRRAPYGCTETVPWRARSDDDRRHDGLRRARGMAAVEEDRESRRGNRTAPRHDHRAISGPLTPAKRGLSRSLADTRLRRPGRITARIAQIPKLTVRVRFPSPAPQQKPRSGRHPASGL
jgi:hypothetical protein